MSLRLSVKECFTASCCAVYVSQSWFDGVAISLAVVFVVGTLGVYYYFDRKGIWVS